MFNDDARLDHCAECSTRATVVVHPAGELCPNRSTSTTRIEFSVRYRGGDEGIGARDLDDAVSYIARAVAHGKSAADYGIVSRVVTISRSPWVPVVDVEIPRVGV